MKTIPILTDASVPLMHSDGEPGNDKSTSQISLPPAKNTHVNVIQDQRYPQNNSEQLISNPTSDQIDLKIITYNCKNVRTANVAINDLLRKEKPQIILLQEHWLFDVHLPTLNEVSRELIAVGKAVDSDNPISPAQMPRGYGGVAILWDKSIDHKIRPLPDGGNRLQCIEVCAIECKLIVVSVYMPTNGYKTSNSEFKEIIEQLFEIYQKYSSTHSVIMGGDFNEDITSTRSSARLSALNQLVQECKLNVKFKDKTFIHPNGRDCSTIDYFLLSDKVMPLQDVQVLNDLCSNVSDHYPVVIKIQSQVRTSSDTATCNTKRRIPWKKVDLDVYKRTVATNIKLLSVECHEESINAAVEEINNTLRQASEESCTVSLSKPASKKKTNKLKVWNKDIAEAIKRSRKSHWKWKNAGKPNHLSNSALVEKKEARLELRRHIRIANARLIVKQQEEIMEARENDVKKLYKLIQKHRGALDNYISELHVGEVTYSGTDVNNGWKQHFETLATPTPNENFDSEYIAMVQRDITYLSSCCQDGNEVIHFTEDEVAKAVQSLNRNKAEDIYGLSTEHLLYAGMPIIVKITEVINAIMSTGHIPPTLKEGIITPIFKNKGSKFDSKNYRGITVTPIITKVLEALLLTLVRPKIESIQNPLQRGFTKNASPLMAATILEETIREAKDSKSCLFTAYLDAKSAFDVVDHSSLFRKLYIAGIQGRIWEIIKDLHTETTSVVKWRGELSEPFRILQGVKQGGLLSTELYKLYVNDLLDRLQQSGLGKRIGHIDCSAPSCADDVALLANNAYSLQGLLDISVNYSNKERYVLQPTKSAVLKIQTGNRSAVEEPTFTLQDSEIQIQDQATHLGLIRNSKANPVDSIDSNIQKARRRLYSLMRPGLHGENGLDPITCIQLYSVYVTPILLYGIEICPPNKTQLQKLDLFSKRTLKQILSLPVTTADSAVYILSGILPIEAQLDKKILMHFGAITRLPESSTEIQLAYRQLYLKDENSNSWFILVKKILQKYNLPEPISLLDYPPSAQQWKNLVNNTVNEKWRISIMEEAYTKSTLKNLNIDAFNPGKRHPILYTESANARDVSRLRTKLLLATGTYILQVNRKAFNQNAVKATCLMCNTEDETKEHFLLRCPSLQETRSEIMVELKKEVCRVVKTPVHIFENSELFTQLIIDSSAIPDVKDGGLSSGRLNFLTRVLCFRLHTHRFKELEKVNGKKLS